MGGGGGSEGGGGLAGAPLLPGSPYGPRILKLKFSWHRRRRSKILAVSLKHWKGRRGGEGGPGGEVHPLHTSLGRGEEGQGALEGPA